MTNVIFIMTDSRSTTRELSCYGNRIISTPNMDRLSEDGTRFNNAFCTNALSLPRKPWCSRVPSPTSNRRRPTWTPGSAMVRMCHLHAAHRPRTRLSRRPSWTADPSRASSSGRRRVRRRRVYRDTHLRQSPPSRNSSSCIASRRLPRPDPPTAFP
ncbi:MAG: hypothetical protein CME19_02385 [Gemmatimonadetes bacterium]|nr:hypothetical protein [Gemmatimonadota bacterium]